MRPAPQLLKTLLLAGIATVLLLALCACGGSKTVTLEQSDSGTTVELDRGQQLTVRLPSNSASGYGWFVADPGALVQTGDGAKDGKPKTQVTGSAEVQVFTFDARDQGSGELALEYRPLRGNSAATVAQRTWSATVNIK